MKRRDFLTYAVTAATLPYVGSRAAFGGARITTSGDPRLATYASPKEAMKAPHETGVFVTALYTGMEVRKPDYIAHVDLDPDSPTYSQVIDRVTMPNVGDELHHFGWNMCSSCHGEPGVKRRFLVVPGLVSGNIHVLDVLDPQKPALIKVLSGKEVAEKAGLSGPHTVHCAPDETVILSMLGDADGNGPGGFLQLDQNFEIMGRWEKSTEGMHYNYDFWYQPRLNVMVSSEWSAPNTVKQGFNPADVEAGKYGQCLHFWDWTTRERRQSINLGSNGWLPLEVRFHHNPDSAHGFVGAALSSTMWHFYRDRDTWAADQVIAVDPVDIEGGDAPIPGLITDLVLSLDDRYLYFSDWLHGDIRQYDVSDPAHLELAGQVWIGGLLGKGKPVRGRKLCGGPQMLQLSLDGKRLYVTNSLYSTWDNQFYPAIAEEGSYMLRIECDTKSGGLTVNEDFFVDFGAEPGGPARAHEMRLLGGDCTSDIWV